MIGDATPLRLVEHAAFLLDAGHDAFDGVEEILEGDRDGVATGRDDGGFVHQIGDVRAGEPGREGRDPIAIDVGRKLDLAHVHVEDLPAALLIGAIDQHLAVEATGPQQRRIEDFRTVGGGQQNDPDARVEAVEFGEELIERLLLLVDAAECALHAAAAERIELVDEDDAGRGLAGLLEQVADAGRPDADEHFDELGSRYGEERDVRLSGDRSRQQRLAGARRADQQNALGQPCTEPAVGLRIPQEGDHLLELELGFLDARDIFESHLRVGLDVDLGARLADRHQPAQALAFGDAAKQHGPQHVENDGRHHPGQDGLDDAARRGALHHDAMSKELVGELRVDAHRKEFALAVRQGLLEGPLDGIRRDRDLGNLAVIEKLLELAVRNGLDLGIVRPEILHHQDADDGRDGVPDHDLSLAIFRFHDRANQREAMFTRTSRKISRRYLGRPP